MTKRENLSDVELVERYFLGAKPVEKLRERCRKDPLVHKLVKVLAKEVREREQGERA